MTQNILLVGATGMFGSQIARRLLAQPDAQVRLLVRPSEDQAKKNALKPFLDRGAEVVEGDLANRAALERATRGIDVIVSAVQGGPEVIIDGQVALAEAGKRNGVRRMLPSDYALDFFNATPGEHMMFDLRRKADDAIAGLGMEHIHVLQGAFMDMFGPGKGTLDYDGGSVAFWGDGKTPIEITTVEDTASMVAHVALDRTLPSGKFAFAGDRVSILDATMIVEKQTGRKFTRHCNGTEADLRKAMAQAATDTSNPFKSVMLAYQLYMMTGQTRLTDLQNTRYPDVHFESFTKFAARTLTPAKAA